MQKNIKLAEHIYSMANDAYLVGHPEWSEIVQDAIKILCEYWECKPDDLDTIYFYEKLDNQE